jgi:hypothetical protein
MKNCSECGKKLGFLEGYKHPIKGEKYLVCPNCFYIIDKSMEFYKKCLFEGRQNHKNECFFWDPKNKKCKNEKHFKNKKRTIKKEK